MDNKHEQEILRFWEKKKIYQKVKRRKGKKFYFLDGPPYATGAIHVGTAWNKILKDAYIRYKRMRGFSVWDQPGYDTHGLPIENKVEKQFGIKSKADIERMGMEKFIQECKIFATKFIGVMSGQFANLGVWMDWSRPYVTLSNEYIEGAWYTFKIAYDKGFLYKGLYPVHVCPHCETAVAYNEIEYTKLTDPSIYVKFKVRGANEYLVIWTTTPWTLPANMGVMAKPDADYVKVDAGDILIVAKDLLGAVMDKLGVTDYRITATMKGRDLRDVEYEHPLADMFEFQRSVRHKIVLSDQYVTMDTGTGLVHTAPGHGAEDYRVGVENHLPVISPVNLNGTYNEQAGELAGIFVKSADRIIIDRLKERNALLLEEKVTHDYPLCWRCSTPLLQLAVAQWFFRVTKIRDKLLAENKKVAWQPKWAGQRFDNWIENLSDWPISRQRYWGIPLPIWICEKCNLVRVVGSRKELKKKIDDLHRPYIDKVELKCKCGGSMRRIPDVLDVWFDSGLASWASLGYPSSKALFKKLWPADLNIEGPDQIRGWWNSQLITSTITFGKAPFRRIIFHGFSLDAHGNKMANSRGNAVTPEEVIDKYGRDALRFYLLSSPAWDDFYFKWTDVDAIAKTLMVMENSFNFVKTYGRKPKRRALAAEDKWILSRLNSVISSATANYDSYNIHKAAADITEFMINDFSRWYIKLVRDRVWPSSSGNKDGAFYVLAQVAEKMPKLIAPVTPFIAEYAHSTAIGKKTESVFLAKWPKADKRLIDKNIEQQMKIVQEITEAVNALRKENGLKLRWPIEKIIVETKDASAKRAIKNFTKMLNYITNSKSTEVGTAQSGFAGRDFSLGKIYISKKILREEALLRELLREVQQQRKQRKLVVTDKIVLFVDNESLKKFEKEIMEKVGAKEVKFASLDGEFGSVKVEDDVAKFRFTLAK